VIIRLLMLLVALQTFDAGCCSPDGFVHVDAADPSTPDGVQQNVQARSLHESPTSAVDTDCFALSTATDHHLNSTQI